MRGTIDESDGHYTTALTRWFLLTGNRLLVSLVVLAGIGAAFVVAEVFAIVTVTRPTRVMWYLNGTVNGLLTLVPIAVGVNQIVLSHEFGSIQDLYQRRTDVTDFRERVERTTGETVSSPHASDFFRSLLVTVSDAARAVRGERRSDGHSASDVETTVESIAEQADRVADELATTDTSMLRTFVIVLGYDNSRQFDEIRRIQGESPDFDAETAEELDRLEELFVEIDAARQFLKTVVVERQLARLSRLLVYTGIPAVTVATLGIFTYRDVAGLTIPHELLVVAAATLVLATLTPLVILGVYILRVATIARRTAAYGPFDPESK